MVVTRYAARQTRGNRGLGSHARGVAATAETLAARAPGAACPAGLRKTGPFVESDRLTRGGALPWHDRHDPATSAEVISHACAQCSRSHSPLPLWPRDALARWSSSRRCRPQPWRLHLEAPRPPPRGHPHLPHRRPAPRRRSQLHSTPTRSRRATCSLAPRGSRGDGRSLAGSCASSRRTFSSGRHRGPFQE